jgi:AraC family transcriptional regulator
MCTQFYQAVSSPIEKTDEPLHILDLGCGTGLEIEALFQRVPNASITGVDLSENMLDQLRKRYVAHMDQITLVTDSYLTMPLGTQAYDYVISTLAVHHVLHDTKRELYRKIHAALKPGGKYMVAYRLVERPAFTVAGKKTWISGQDNAIFGRFWERCRAEGLFELFDRIRGTRAGPQTNGVTLGISRVEQDPSKRSFDYMIAVESPVEGLGAGLETYEVPACQWAVFECRGQVPDSIVEAEIYAFTQWLPGSGFVHANAPEMEVYPPEADEGYCEFWLPIQGKA